MDLDLTKSMVSAAAAGLMLGALTGCGAPPSGAASPGSGAAATQPAGGGDASDASGATAATDPALLAAEGKACCKAMNECRGKGACKTDANECAGKNECKGKGGCNGHCPK